jgi:hypothetical protein
MLRSGIAGGMRRDAEAEREPVEVDAVPAPHEDTAWTVLTDDGFQFIGEWTQDPKNLIRFEAQAPTDTYSMVFDNTIGHWSTLVSI